MTFKTIKGVLHPDGSLTLSDELLPDHATPVMVTLLEHDEEKYLTALGDYQQNLTEYEERLGRGEIQWQ